MPPEDSTTSSTSAAVGGAGATKSEQLPQLGSREALQRQGDGAGLALEPSDGASDAFVVDRGANREDGQHPDATRRRCVVEQHEQVQEQRLARGIGPLQIVDDEHHGLVAEHVEQGLLRPAPQVGRILLDSPAGPIEVEGPDSEVRPPSGAIVARAVVIGR